MVFSLSLTVLLVPGSAACPGDANPSQLNPLSALCRRCCLLVIILYTFLPPSYQWDLWLVGYPSCCSNASPRHSSPPPDVSSLEQVLHKRLRLRLQSVSYLHEIGLDSRKTEVLTLVEEIVRDRVSLDDW